MVFEAPDPSWCDPQIGHLAKLYELRWKCLSKYQTKFETNHLLKMNYFLEDQKRDLIKLCVLLLKGKFHGSGHAHLSTCYFFCRDMLNRPCKRSLAICIWLCQRYQRTHRYTPLAVTWSTYVQIAEVDFANTTNAEFIVDPKILFFCWWTYSYSRCLFTCHYTLWRALFP